MEEASNRAYVEIFRTPILVGSCCVLSLEYSVDIDFVEVNAAKYERRRVGERPGAKLILLTSRVMGQLKTNESSQSSDSTSFNTAVRSESPTCESCLCT